MDEEEYTVQCVMKVNQNIEGAFIFSSGKIWAALRPSAIPRMLASFICLINMTHICGPLTVASPQTHRAGGAARIRLISLIGQSCTTAKFHHTMQTEDILSSLAMFAPCNGHGGYHISFRPPYSPPRSADRGCSGCAHCSRMG